MIGLGDIDKVNKQINSIYVYLYCVHVQGSLYNKPCITCIYYQEERQRKKEEHQAKEEAALVSNTVCEGTATILNNAMAGYDNAEYISLFQPKHH